MSSSEPFMTSSKSSDSRWRWTLRVRAGNKLISAPPGSWRETAGLGARIEDSEGE